MPASASAGLSADSCGGRAGRVGAGGGHRALPLPRCPYTSSLGTLLRAPRPLRPQCRVQRHPVPPGCADRQAPDPTVYPSTSRSCGRCSGMIRRISPTTSRPWWERGSPTRFPICRPRARAFVITRTPITTARPGPGLRPDKQTGPIIPVNARDKSERSRTWWWPSTTPTAPRPGLAGQAGPLQGGLARHHQQDRYRQRPGLRPAGPAPLPGHAGVQPAQHQSPRLQSQRGTRLLRPHRDRQALFALRNDLNSAWGCPPTTSF